MPKITRADGPSYTDDNGNPVAGPVGMVVEPTVDGDTEERTSVDEHGEVTTDVTDHDAVRQQGTVNYGADGAQDTDASPTDGQFIDAQGNATQFDPNQHTAQEVLDYLGGVGPDEQTRVLNAEAADKNRTTITTSKYANTLTDEQRSEQDAAAERPDDSFNDEE